MWNDAWWEEEGGENMTKRSPEMISVERANERPVRN